MTPYKYSCKLEELFNNLEFDVILKLAYIILDIV